MSNNNISTYLTGTLCACLLFCTLCLCSCSGKNEKVLDKADVAITKEAGKKIAETLKSETDSMLIENTLIEVRERENKLRKNGYENAADIYINTFLETLDSVNPALASSIK